MIIGNNTSSISYGQKSSDLINLVRFIIFESDLDAALEKIVKSGKELTNADMCNIGLIEENSWHRMYFYPANNIIKNSYSATEGIMGWVTKNREPLYVSDIASPDIEKGIKYIKCREGTVSELAVPVFNKSECIGVLNVESNNKDGFNETSLNILTVLAELAARAILNFRHRETLIALQEIDKKLVRSPKSIDTLQLIWERACKLIGTKDIKIRLVEGDKLIPMVGVDNDDIKAATWKIGQCIVGKVAETKEPILENDVQSNQLFIEAFNSLDPGKRKDDLSKINSEIAVPLLFRDKIIGVLNAHSPKKNKFSKDDLELLCALADGAAIAIENIEQYEQIDAFRQIDKKIAQITSFPHLNETLNLINDKASRLVRTRNIRIRLLKGDKLVPIIGVDNDQIEAATWRIGQGIVGKAAETKEPILENDVQSNQLFIEAFNSLDPGKRKDDLSKINSEIAVPLLFRDKVIGVIDAYSPKKNAFTEEDRKLLFAFADQAAIAIEDMRLFNDLAKYVGIIEKINEIGTYITTITKVDVKEVLYETAKGLHEIINADIPLIYLLDENRNFSGIIYGDIRRDWEEMCKPRVDGSGLKAIHANAIAVAQENGELDINPFPKKKGVKTTIAQSIIIDGFDLIENGHHINEPKETLGILYMHFLGKKCELNRDELKKFRPIAEDIALLIKPYICDINLKEGIELEAIRKKVKQQIENEQIVTRINEIADPDILLIYVYNQKEDNFGKLCYSSIGKSWIDKSRPRKDGLGMIALKNRHFAIANNSKSPFINPNVEEKGVKTTAAVPLIFGDKELGVMYLHFLQEERDFDPMEIKAIETFASNAAIAIDKANLMTKLKSVFEIGRKINNSSRIDDVLLNVGKYGNEIIGEGVIHIWKYESINSSQANWKYLSINEEGLSAENILAKIEPRADGIGSEVIKKMEPIYIEDAKNDPLASDSLERQGIGSLASFPIRIDQENLGVIYFHFPTKKVFSDEEKLRLSLFSSQIEVALNNANQRTKLDELEKLKGINDINETLDIEPKELEKVISIKDLEIDGIKDNAELKKNIRIILQRLFWNASNIYISQMDSGFSGCGVMMVRPHYGGVTGKEVIVKFGEKKAIEEEEKNYNTYVKWFIGGIRSANLMTSAYSGELGGIVYSLVGNPMKPGDFSSFAHYYQNGTIREIETAIDKLFEETCVLWYRGRIKQPLGRIKQPLSKIDALLTELPQKEEIEKFSVGFKNKQISFYNMSGYTFIDPISWAYNYDLIRPSDIYICITHGDLNKNNLILDKDGNTWLIDFYRTNWSYVLRDFIRLETTIKFELLSKDIGLDSYFYLERLLFTESQDDMENLSKYPNEVQKAVHAIQKIRSAAKNLLGITHFDITQYYIGLLAQTLKFLTFEDINKLDFVLMSASVISSELENTHLFEKRNLPAKGPSIINYMATKN